MSGIYKTNVDENKANKASGEELVCSHRKLMDLIRKPETVSKILEWFGKESKDERGRPFYPNLHLYGTKPNTMFHAVRGAQTGQNFLPLIVNQDKQRPEFVTFLVDRLQTEKDAAIASVKTAMETGPGLVKMLSAVEEKFPITSIGKWTNICVG